MTKWLGAVLGLGGLCVTTAVHAQPYPARPVTIVVTAAAGGLTDIVARAVGQQLSETWGKPVVIENKGGAGHNIGAASVAKAAPDGYTLMVSESGTFVSNPYLYAKGTLPYDAETDFAPISGLASYTQALVTHPSLPARTVADLIALAKSQPGEISFGTAGIGSAPHMNIELLENMAGIRLVPVHYRGAAPALTDLLGGHIKLMSVSMTLSLEPSRAGRITMLGVGGRARLPAAPEVPTIAETGLPGYEAVSWVGMFTAKGTPREIVTKINADAQRILADPAFRDRFLAPQMLEPMKGSPDTFAADIKSETQKWVKVIREQKLSIE
ncbi:MAG TPA: tripartite tricarboxylate transporter substrate binding protein [Xanthobacteraceae bacterium]|jgi:tripartite-type tricarboxylate transporter receptor subunit TctC